MAADPPRTRAPEARDVDARAVRRAFGRAAASYDGAAALQREVGARLATRLDVVKLEPRRVLDLGCGTGAALPLLATRYPRAALVAIDAAPPMLAAARSREDAARSFAGRVARALTGSRGSARVVPVRGRDRLAARPGERGPAVVEPDAAVGRRRAARVRGGAARARRRRPVHVHDLRPRHAAGTRARLRRDRRPHPRLALRRHARPRRPAGRGRVRRAGHGHGDDHRDLPDAARAHGRAEGARRDQPDAGPARAD